MGHNKNSKSILDFFSKGFDKLSNWTKNREKAIDKKEFINKFLDYSETNFEKYNKEFDFTVNVKGMQFKKSVNIEKTRNWEYLKLAFGFTLSTLTVPLLNSVDTAVVGNLSNPVFIGGVTLGGTIFNTIYWLFGFLRVSTSGYSAKAFGESNRKEEITVLVRPMIISILLTFFIGIEYKKDIEVLGF